jgi:tetratricopeptide (TPR) repeat protein
MNYFEKNIEILREHRPQLADVILSDRTDEGVAQLTASESGETRVIFTKHDGEEVRIHSAEDPVKCASDAVDVLSKTEKEGLIAILGFGLGYFAQELLKRFEKGHMMLIYEASPQLFKAALEARDLTDVLTSDRTEILIGPDADDFSFLNTNHHHLVNGKMYLVKHLPSLRLNETAYSRFQKRLEEEKLLSLSNVGTAVGLGKSFVGAFLQNVPNILKRAGVTALKDIFKGRSAIVVAAGPSLEKNLHLLKKAKGKAVIIAVDAALPTLLPAGILPDLLVAIDPLPENVAFFKDNPLLKHVPFVCLSQYTPEIVDLYPGPLFLNMAEQNLVTLWLRPFWEDKGSIICFGGSVAHLGFAAAEYLGCSTIGLVGLDLSFDAKFHAGDASSLLTEMHGQLYEFKDRADKATDIFGEARYTLPSFLNFKTSLENHIKGSDGVFVNATEGGLPLDGFTNMRLSDFVEEYCDAPGLDAAQEIACRADTEVAYNLEGLIEEVQKSRDTLRNIRKTSWKILRYIRKVQDLRNKGREDDEEFHRILARIERLTTKVRHPALNLIAAYHYQLELYLKRQAVIEIDEMEDKLERLDAQLERGLSYYGELISAIDPFVKELDGLAVNLRREKKINRILGDMALSEAERLSAIGMVSRKAGRIALAVKYMEALRLMGSGGLGAEHKRVFDPESTSPDGMVLLAELYMRQYRYYEGRELLSELSTAERRGGVSKGEALSRVDDLLKACCEKISAWEKREAKMSELLRNGENSYGGTLETGFFYFKLGNFERAENAYLAAVGEHSNGKSAQLVAAFYGLAHTHLKLRENQKAVDAFAAALQVDPGNALIYRDLALLAIENGNRDSGEMFLIKALELAPWSNELYVLLANLYLGMNEMKKAIALYEYGIQVNPQNTNLPKELALLYQKVIKQENEIAG